MPRTFDATRSYVRRVIDDELDLYLAQVAAIELDGPKGVGKTATAVQRCRTTRRLDRPGDRAVLQADPMLVGHGEPPILVDEWQRVPEVRDAVRALVDQRPTDPGVFILTGSSPTEADGHSGAGRILSLRMRPLTLFERGIGIPATSFAGLLAGEQPAVEGRTDITLSDYVDEIVAGGFPGLRHLTGRALIALLDDYIERVITHDLPEAGHTVRRPATVRSWLRAYAAATATTTSWEKLREAASRDLDQTPTKTTTQTYTELLRQLRIVDPLEAWEPTNNHLKRTTGAGKHHLADPALAARLVGRSTAQLLAGDERTLPMPRDGAFLGALFESLVALSVRTYAQRVSARSFHLRTEGGRHEIDFIIETNDGILALEVKLAGAVGDSDVRHLEWLRETIGDQLLDAAVITTGSEAYRRADGIAVIPLALLGP